jgi:hypothetical protein
VERVKALLEPDSTIAGKLGALIRELYRGSAKDGDGVSGELRLAHRIHRVRTFARESLYHRYQRESAGPNRAPSPVDREAMEREEAELLIRLKRQLGVKRVGEWLDDQGGRERLLFAADLVKDESSFIRFIYSVLYADSRLTFGYSIEDNDDSDAIGDNRERTGGPIGASVRAGAYVAPDVLLRRKS